MCAAKFQDKKEFTHHNLEVHNGVKPFVCATCGNAFTIIYNLRSHIKSVHEGCLPYSCEICKKQFYKKQDLLKHVQSSQSCSAHVKIRALWV